MNNLTFEIVTQVAQEHKAAARKNDLAFDFKVRNAHWDEMIGRYGWQLKERALRLWRQYHPEMFVWDEDCWVLDDGNVWYATCDYVISTIVVRVLKPAEGCLLGALMALVVWAVLVLLGYGIYELGCFVARLAGAG